MERAGTAVLRLILRDRVQRLVMKDRLDPDDANLCLALATYLSDRAETVTRTSESGGESWLS